LNKDDRLVLANAVYLEGEWQKPFKAKATYDGRFVTAQGQASVKMMRQVDEFRYAEVDGAKLIELSYKGGLSMIVVLPEHDDGLPQIEDRLAGLYARGVGNFAGVFVDLELPRFTATTRLNVVGLLEAMGMRRAFHRGIADFSGMVTNPDASLFIGDAIQKSWIETNELGTEAAAVTAVTLVGTSSHARHKPKPVIFHADHPFLYVIRDMASGAILFVGRVVQPD
jgi:serpin B